MSMERFLLKTARLVLQTELIFFGGVMVSDMLSEKQRKQVANAWGKVKHKSGAAAKQLLLKYAPDVVDQLAEEKARAGLTENFNDLLKEALDKALDERGVKGDFSTTSKKTQKSAAKKTTAKKAATKKQQKRKSPTPKK